MIISVYKISIQYTDLFKRYRTGTICVTYGSDGRDGRTYGQRWYYMPPTPPIENGGDIKNKNCLLSMKITSILVRRITRGYLHFTVWKWSYYYASEVIINFLTRDVRSLVSYPRVPNQTKSRDWPLWYGMIVLSTITASFAPRLTKKVQ